jgi:hypothetical protein
VDQAAGQRAGADAEDLTDLPGGFLDERAEQRQSHRNEHERGCADDQCEVDEFSTRGGP